MFVFPLDFIRNKVKRNTLCCVPDIVLLPSGTRLDIYLSKSGHFLNQIAGKILFLK